MIDIRFNRVTETARTPAKAHDTDAGYDLCSDGVYTLWGGGTVVVSTGISLELPSDICALVMSRSGLAAQHGVFVLNAPGLIDPGYTGEIKVVLCKIGGKDMLISPGDRIAQMVFMPVLKTPEVLAESQSVSFPEEATEIFSLSERGDKGLGSTGI